jgi:hypothetical protein
MNTTIPRAEKSIKLSEQKITAAIAKANLPTDQLTKALLDAFTKQIAGAWKDPANLIADWRIAMDTVARDLPTARILLDKIFDRVAIAIFPELAEEAIALRVSAAERVLRD